METHSHLGTGSLIFGFALPVYPLTVSFLQEGVPLAGIPFCVRDNHGHVVLRAISDGPYLRLRLPPGDYRVSARMNGETLESAVAVGLSGEGHVSFDSRRPAPEVPTGDRSHE